MPPSEPVIFIDDSDIIKPDGRRFENLGLVRDGSMSSDSENAYEKGYHATEAYVLIIKDIYLVMVYGLFEYLMMLATNKKIHSKEDVINIARLDSPAGRSRRTSDARNRYSSL